MPRVLLWGFSAFAVVWVLFTHTTLAYAEDEEISTTTARIKDIASFEGVRTNLLIGYGLVVGLNGTGDGLDAAPFTRESLVSMLERLGVNTRGQIAQMRTKNVAAVMVTAHLPAFARQGTSIDVSISAMGNAKSLNGGTLLVTPLLGADGEVYAVAQGAVATGGFVAGGTQTGSSITKGVPTSGRVISGGLIEREVAFRFQDVGNLKIALRNPDFTTARRIAEVINIDQGDEIAAALDPATVQLRLPRKYRRNPFELVAAIEQLTIQPDQMAQIVLDESNGILIITKDVKINTVAVAHQNLTIRIEEKPQTSQPNAFSGGRTILAPQSQVAVEEEPKRLAVLPEAAGLNDLVAGLNALGLKPRDMIPIFENIKAAGAIHAEVKVR